jgi:hypothetical protein
MKCRKTILIASAVLALVLAFLFGLSLRPGQPPLTVRFLHFTNDSSGQQLACFTVTNRSEFVVKRESHCSMQLQHEPSTFPGYHVGAPVLLKPGESEEVLIPVPTNRGPWRVALKAIPVDSSYHVFEKARTTTGSSKAWTRWYSRQIVLCWSTAEGEWLGGDER